MIRRRLTSRSAALCALAVGLSSLVVFSCGSEQPADSSARQTAQLTSDTTAPAAVDGVSPQAPPQARVGASGGSARASWRLIRGPAPDRRGSKSGLYWGATIGEQLTGDKAPWDMRAVTKFQRKAGKGLSLIQFYIPWVDCSSGRCEPYKFPTTPLDNVRRYGAIPVVSWSSDSSPPSPHQPRFQLADLIAGRHDRLIRRWAQNAAAWGHPFFLRFDWEMNGFWFAWGAHINGNRPSQFPKAWRHVHRIFDAAGADNVTWVWCPNVDFNRKLVSLRKVYPGGRWVDWTCLDGFNWGSHTSNWQTFDQVYRSTYKRVVRIAPKKPMLIGEIGSTDAGGSKAAWIRNLLRKLVNGYSKVRGFAWFDVHDRGTNWPIETSRSATRAFRRGINHRLYAPNVYGGLAGRAIKPPRR